VRVCQSSALVSMVQDAISSSAANLGPADGGLELVEPAELAQFGPEQCGNIAPARADRSPECR